MERAERREQLKTMPGWKIHWACSNFVSCFEIFRGNSNELLSFLQNPPSFSFQFLPDVQARIQKIEFDTAVLRLLHNYVASASTLIDHCRRLKTKFLTLDSQNKYDEQIKEIFADPRIEFIKDLRNFMLHCDLLGICNRVNLNDGSWRVTLLPEKLLQWENWKSEVKTYLRSLHEQKDNILLCEIVEYYNQRTIIFTKWFLNEIVSSNYNDLEDVYKINDEILKAVHEDGFVTDPLIVQFFTRKYQLIT